MATSPTHSHDAFVYGELKDWLDGVEEEVERSDDDDVQVVTELACWLRRLAKGGKAGFKDVTRALCKEGYGHLWRMLIEVFRGGQDRAQLDR